MEINGNQIIEYRKRKGLTQSQLADEIGITIRTIQNYESGTTIPMSKLKLFATLLESEQTQKELEKMELDKTTKSKFRDITLDEISMFVIHHKNELMKNALFILFIDKIAHERALKIIKEM